MIKAIATRIVGDYNVNTMTTRERRRADNRPASQLIWPSHLNAKGIARYLDQNHDLAKGVLDVIEAQMLGANGLMVDHQPLRDDGSIHAEFAEELEYWHKKWEESPEVSGEYSWAGLQRILARTLYRDGEYLIKDIYTPRFKHRYGIPYSIEALETDYLASDYNDPDNMLYQGIKFNEWWQPVTYYLRDHPENGHYQMNEPRQVSAKFIRHAKLTDRLRQPRGISVFASTFRRFNDLMDYEDSERIAAKVASNMVMYLRRDPTMLGHSFESDPNRTFEVSPGILWDNLTPGEEPVMMDSNRPNINLEAYRNSQLKGAAAGSKTSQSSIAKTYDGTYSGQRQELIEQYAVYGVMATHFGWSTVLPIKRRVTEAIILSGKVKVPPGIREDSVFDMVCHQPTPPWIDPGKESAALVALKDAGLASPQEIIRKRGRNPREVKREIDEWGKRNEEES